MKTFVHAMNLAFTIAGCILFGFVVGYLLDNMLQSKPIFMIIGLLLGTGCAFMALYRMAISK